MSASFSCDQHRNPFAQFQRNAYGAAKAGEAAEDELDELREMDYETRKRRIDS